GRAQRVRRRGPEVRARGRVQAEAVLRQGEERADAEGRRRARGGDALRNRPRGAAAVFVTALAARLVLIAMFPGVHGEDSVARLARSDTLVLGSQLPRPQAVVMAVRAIAPDPVWTRAVFAAIGAGAAAALCALVWRLSGAVAGLGAGALAAAHPLLA